MNILRFKLTLATVLVCAVLLAFVAAWPAWLVTGWSLMLAVLLDRKRRVVLTDSADGGWTSNQGPLTSLERGAIAIFRDYYGDEMIDARPDLWDAKGHAFMHWSALVHNAAYGAEWADPDARRILAGA